MTTIAEKEPLTISPKSKKPLNVQTPLEPITLNRNKEELSQAKIDNGIKCFTDILFFTEYVVPHRKEVDGVYYETPFFHLEIWDACRLDHEGNLVIVVPRLHGKTTAVKMFILWAICFKITDKIVYLANEGLGEKMVSDIMYELQYNERIIKMF